MMHIRRERHADLDATHEVHRLAFAVEGSTADPVEVGLVVALRTDPGWVDELSWVAVDADGTIVGHVVCTVGAVGETPVLGLGPIGVLPAHQGTHVGHGLMRSVIAASDALGYPLIALVGHLDFYPRFGFAPAESLGIEAPDPSWGDHFQVRTLHTYASEVRGAFRYAAAFEALLPDQ